MTDGKQPGKSPGKLKLFWVIIVSAGFVGLSIVRASLDSADSSKPDQVEATDPDHAPSLKHPVVIRKPSGPPRIATDQKDIHGNVVSVSCATCHSRRKPNADTRNEKDLDEFHQGLKFAHGQLSCLACHNQNDYDTLKLADGTSINYSEVMELCAQCHGPQMRAYKHGAHGGMTGYWDRKRGAQHKNNCVDCHNPHAPQFPKMLPTFKPKDRFLKAQRSGH